MPFVVKIYAQWYDEWTGEYKKPELHMAWPIAESTRIDASGYGPDLRLSFDMDWGLRRKYTGFPDCHENTGIYPGANCRQIVSFHDDRNRVICRKVIEERPGGEYLLETVMPWIELQLEYCRRIMCLGDLA